ITRGWAGEGDARRRCRLPAHRPPVHAYRGEELTIAKTPIQKAIASLSHDDTRIRQLADRLLPHAIRDVEGLEEDRRVTLSMFDAVEPEVALVITSWTSAAASFPRSGPSSARGCRPARGRRRRRHAASCADRDAKAGTSSA